MNEKKRIFLNWRSRIQKTSKMLTEKSLEGWHLKDIDEFDAFYFDEGEAKYYTYLIEENGRESNLLTLNSLTYTEIYKEEEYTIYRGNEIEADKIVFEENKFALFENDEETEWLSEMLLKGKYFVSVFDGTYSFYTGNAAKTKYMIDYQGKLSNPKEYLELYENMGWIYIFGIGGKHYFRKQIEPVELFEEKVKGGFFKRLKVMFKGKKSE